VRPHNPATGFRPPSMVSAEPFSHGTGTLRCLQKEMAIYRHSSLWRDPDDSQIVCSWPLTKLNGGLSRLHSADEDAVSWLTSYGLWHTYKKKKIGQSILLADFPAFRNGICCCRTIYLECSSSCTPKPATFCHVLLSTFKDWTFYRAYNIQLACSWLSSTVSV